MKNLLVLIGVLVLLGLASCAITGSRSWTPLPESGTASAVNIIPPGPDVPPQIAAYSGIWEGTWDNGRAVTVVIEQISLLKIIAIYSCGSLGTSEEGWRRVIGRVENDSIVLQWSGRTVTLTITDPKKNNFANAEYRQTEILRATLRKKTN
ncbi:MAG: hypothetical protein Q8M92_07260 [Candidatus Subteraquimicrobiales bacterium]|nr:hypothetical protein [Candidatus Subteraquimicrobiales bacterium]